MKQLRYWLVLFFGSSLFTLLYAGAPQVMLANRYTGQNVVGWLASEKLDGVRGYWDGKKLYSRNGTLLPMPAGWAENFPPFPLDGELFIARGRFDETSGKIRSGDWSDVSLHVFDVPQASGGLLKRLAKLRHWLDKYPSKHIVIIKQIPVKNIAQVRRLLADTEAKGGEGIMLRAPDAPYTAGRSSRMLKLKSSDDEECTVTAHHPGKGKYRHVLGSLSCRLADGRIIRIGSGFSDAERANPPAVGKMITFRYRGKTSTGKPRFATFLRIRSDADLSK